MTPRPRYRATVGTRTFSVESAVFPYYTLTAALSSFASGRLAGAFRARNYGYAAMGGWLSFPFFFFAGYSGLVFFTRGVLSWRRSRYDVLGLVFLEYVDKAFAEVPDFIEDPTPVQVLIEFVFFALLMFAMAPGLSGGRGDGNCGRFARSPCPFLAQYTRCCPLGPCTGTGGYGYSPSLRSPTGSSWFALFPYTRHGPFSPCTVTVHGAPGHNRWGVVEPLPVKTQGGTMNCLLTPVTKYCYSVWFSSVVAKCATRTHSDSGGHESWLQEWSTPLNGAVLGVRRNSEASNAMLEHRRDPVAQRGRMSGLVRDMFTR